MYNILICDDQPDIVNALRVYLSENEQYQLFEAFNGQQALQIVHKQQIHLAILDIMMPVMDGIAAVREIRRSSNIPIILLTAKSQTQDLVAGLNAGADDYITKPFIPDEVLARVASHLRRYAQLGTQTAQQEELVVGGLMVNDRTKSASVDGQGVTLTPIEYNILKLLMENPGKVYSTKALYEAVWQEPAQGCEGAVAVHIRHLREKIEINPSEPRYLKVVWGQGYKVEGGR